MLVKPKAKSWNFPKIHSHQHLVDDIMAKGVMQNYNTKPNEKMHGPLKDAYQLRTNFKEILWVDSWCNAASFIHQQIDLQEELLHQATSEDDNDDADEDLAKQHYTVTVASVFAKHPEIVPLVSGEKVSFKAFKGHNEIQLYGLLKVNYENTVDWNMCTDYLRCSPNFYNHPQYDCVIIEGSEGPFFMQIIMFFSCVVSGKSFPLALVHPFDKPVTTSNAKLDKELGFYRVQAQKRTQSTFISIYAIIHGMLLVEDYGFKSTDGMKEYLVINSVDSDLFLRMKSLKYVGCRWN
ncbi:hypothetical protein EDD85DRAFT_792333 [Armillaria nabsnona]|nr:hypothetical protein EDD85DRAFT_792333 [Armillaria nabsnona]